MRLSLLVSLTTLFTMSCQSSSTPVPTGEDCEWNRPAGEPEQFTLGGQDLGGVTVAESRECGKWGARYIEVRGSGTRRLMLASEMPDGSQKCTEAPEDPDACPQVQIDHFVAAVWPQLSEAGVHAIGTGLGPCGEEGSYDDWNFSIAISDWSKADQAVQIVADEMKRWSIGNQMGVAIRSQYCSSIR